MPNRALILKQQFEQSLGSPWQHILPPSRLEAILAEEAITYRNGCDYNLMYLFHKATAVAIDFGPKL
jgi:hypothetical protein